MKTMRVGTADHRIIVREYHRVIVRQHHPLIVRENHHTIVRQHHRIIVRDHPVMIQAHPLIFRERHRTIVRDHRKSVQELNRTREYNLPLRPNPHSRKRRIICLHPNILCLPSISKRREDAAQTQCALPSCTGRLWEL